MVLLWVCARALAPQEAQWSRTCLPAQETGFDPGSGDPLEEEVAALSSILAWKLPWTEESGGLKSTGLQSRT